MRENLQGAVRLRRFSKKEWEGRNNQAATCSPAPMLFK
jgi:hypothetical protein